MVHLIIATVLFLFPIQQSLHSSLNNLVGSWSGKCEVFAEFKKEKYPSSNPADSIFIQFKINPDYSVTGTIGNAFFKKCRLKKNRGPIERLLNLNTDYIICDGFLSGQVVGDDKESRRNFTIPFNIIDGEITGSFMVLKTFEYPFPMFPRLKLKRVQE